MVISTKRSTLKSWMLLQLIQPHLCRISLNTSVQLEFPCGLMGKISHSLSVSSKKVWRWWCVEWRHFEAPFCDFLFYTPLSNCTGSLPVSIVLSSMDCRLWRPPGVLYFKEFLFLPCPLLTIWLHVLLMNQCTIIDSGWCINNFQNSHCDSPSLPQVAVTLHPFPLLFPIYISFKQIHLFIFRHVGKFLILRSARLLYFFISSFVDLNLSST